MKIEYETNHADIEAWSRYSLTFPAARRAVRWGALWMALPASLIVAGTAYNSSGSALASAIIGGLLFTVTAALSPSVLRHEALKKARKALDSDPTNAALGHHTLEVTPECVTETCSHHTLSVRWPAVDRAIRTDNHLFIFLRSTAAIIVPLRVFVTKADRDTFIENALQFVPSA